MFGIRAYFWGNDVYIGEKNRYAIGEILTAYLNTKHSAAEEKYDRRLTSLQEKLLLSEDMPYDAVVNYNRNVYAAMNLFGEIENWLTKLPPYKRIWQREVSFEDILNAHSCFFEDGLDMERRDYLDEDTETQYGFGEKAETGYYHMRLNKFELSEPVGRYGDDPALMESMRLLNRNIEQYFGGYRKFLESYLAVHKIFRPFIEQYLHRAGGFPTPNEAAQAYLDFNHEHLNSFAKLPCRMESFGYKVLQDENKQPILCEEIYFSDLQSFLYYDFWQGLKRNYIPNVCKNCGAFFLIRGGKYFSYCDRKLKNEPSKTCRDVGSRRRYDEKCKNDPVWQTYNRAYKTHYARYMKKKMTVSEFEEWSRFASALRDKALAEQIAFAQYYTEIRK